MWGCQGSQCIGVCPECLAAIVFWISQTTTNDFIHVLMIGGVDGFNNLFVDILGILIWPFVYQVVELSCGSDLVVA